MSQAIARILLITDAPFLQAGNQSIRRTISGLVDKGFKIEIWLLGRLPPTEIPNNVTIKCFSKPRFFLQILKQSLYRRQVKRAKKLKMELKPVNQIVDYRNDELSQWWIGLPTIMYFTLRCFLHCLLNYRSLQAINAVWGYERGAILPAKAVSWLLKVPFISSFQGTVLYFYMNRYGLLKTFLKLPLDLVTTWTKADLVIMTDDGTRGLDILLKLGHTPSKVAFVPNGVDPNELFQVRPRPKHTLGLSQAEYLFVVASRLVIHKRIDRALKLVKALKDIGINGFKLIIIGDGPDEELLRSMAQALAITDRVVFLGGLPYEETLSILAAADMVWSFQEGSNLNNTVQDALALQKHVLTIDDGSLKGFLEKSPAINRELILTVPLHNFYEAGAQAITSWMKRYKYYDKVDAARNLEGIWTWDNRMEVIKTRILGLITDRRKK